MPVFDIGLEQVSLSYATKNICDNVTVGVNEGDRIGIVGRNGDGKTTVLHLLSGSQQPDSGRVSARNGLSLGILEQYDSLDDNDTVQQAALGGQEEYEWASRQHTREIVETLLSGIGLDSRIGSLSGGQRRRVDLARLLLGDWDILLLDEPTNHLDMATIRWLAEHLKDRWQRNAGALLVVTHDRWFLDDVCTHMWEVHDGDIDPFEGGYSAYIEQRVERDRQADAAEARRRNLARKELYECYAGRMLSVCLRYAGDRETAQDLMHDGFLKLFDSFDKFTWRGEGSLRAWMERVMVNTVLQYLRKNDVMNQSSALENAPEAYEEPEGSSIDVIPQKVLMQFISELPAGYRTVFNLYIFEEKSHKEIARLLGINEKSSASQLTRAKATLAAKVREWMKRND